MNATTPAGCGRFDGVREIAAFNWHWYVAGAVAIIAAVVICAALPLPNVVRTFAIIGICIALLWSLGSLAVSHWVYDRSPLRRWRWVASTLTATPLKWCNVHCGLDESSAALRKLFPRADGVVLDIFDPEEMTEPSIMRARGESRATAAANFRRLPLDSGSVDAAFAFFAAHELRKPKSREAFCAELRRIVGTDGEIIVAEHLRDAPNFSAFGPGAFHFFSRREWLRVFQRANLHVRDEFRITPFVRVFVLRRQHEPDLAS